MKKINVSVLGYVLLAGAVLTGCSVGSDQRDATASTLGVQSSAQEESELRRRARLRVELAMEYYRSRQYTIALAELRNAQGIDDGFPELHNAFALVYMDINEIALAEESFQRALRLAPNDSETNNNYGWYLCQNGQPAKALNYFRAALRNPLYATPVLAARNAGICSQRSGDLAAALDFLQRAFRFDPGDGLTMYFLADVLYRSNDLERARFYINRLNQQTDPSAANLWLAIKIERKRGDTLAEQVLVTQLRRRFPESREFAAFKRGAFDE